MTRFSRVEDLRVSIFMLLFPVVGCLRTTAAEIKMGTFAGLAPKSRAVLRGPSTKVPRFYRPEVTLQLRVCLIPVLVGRVHCFPLRIRCLYVP